MFPLLILGEQDLGVHASGMRCSLQDMHEHSGKDREDIKFAYLKDSCTIFLCCRSNFFPSTFFFLLPVHNLSVYFSFVLLIYYFSKALADLFKKEKSSVLVWRNGFQQHIYLLVMEKSSDSDRITGYKQLQKKRWKEEQKKYILFSPRSRPSASQTRHRRLE